MKKSTKGIGIFIGVVAIIALLAYQQSRPQSHYTIIPEGQEPTHGTAKELQKAPAWRLPDVYGKKFTFTQFQGKVTVISFWSVWCAACKTELQTLNEVQKEIANPNLQLIGICLGYANVGEVITLTKALNIYYPVFLGDTKVVASFGNFNIIPATFIIDKKGNVVQYLHGTHSKQRFIDVIQSLL